MRKNFDPSWKSTDWDSFGREGILEEPAGEVVWKHGFWQTKPIFKATSGGDSKQPHCRLMQITLNPWPKRRCIKSSPKQPDSAKPRQKTAKESILSNFGPSSLPKELPKPLPGQEDSSILSMKRVVPLSNFFCSEPPTPTAPPNKASPRTHRAVSKTGTPSFLKPASHQA